MGGLRLACSCFVAIVAVLSSVGGGAWGADEYVAPPLAEREAVAALRAKGAIIQVDGNYRVSDIILTRNCSNDDLKLLTACEKLSSLQIATPQITDSGIEHLKALPKLASIMVTTSGLSESGIATLRGLTLNLRIMSVPGSRGSGGPPTGGNSGPGGFSIVPGSNGSAPPFGMRGTSGPGTFGAVSTNPASLVTNPAVQDDLKLTPEQRQQIRTAQDMAALLRARDEKVTAVLTDEQRLRLKQIELQQGGATALARTEIAKELGLSDDQRTAVRKAIDETNASITEANSGLRQGPVTADSLAKLREKTTELNKQRDEKVQALLNDEQRQAWLAMQGPKGPVITAWSGPGSFGGQSAPTGPVRSTTLPASVRGKPADDVGMKFIDSGVTARVGGYMPVRAEMNGSADSVKTAPEGLDVAKYGALKLGERSWTFILDETEGRPAKLYVDTNGDGDLTNDPATTWAGRKVGNFTQYSGSGKVDLGGGSIGTVNMYRFDPADSQRATLKNTLMFYPDYGYELTLTLDGKEFTTAVSGEGGTMPLWIDRDGNKQRSSKTETVRLGSPFNFTGTTYVLNRDGNEFKLEKPNISLPVAPLPPNLAVGQKAIPFEIAALDGKKIDFPKSYAGKLVLLDFWATWCGPCIAELPNVKKAYADWHEKGFEILGISFDNANMEEKVKTFLQEHDLPWSQIYGERSTKCILRGVIAWQGRD